MVARACRAAAAFFERIVEIDLRGLQGRRSAEDQPCQQRDASSKNQDAIIDLELHPEWKFDRYRRSQQVEADNCEGQPQHATDDSEEYALSEQLPEDAPAGG